MGKIIKVKPNEDGRLVANLYGKAFDLTELAGEDGKGEFKAFGETYQFETVSKSQTRRKKAAKNDNPAESEETQLDE